MFDDDADDGPDGAEPFDGATGGDDERPAVFVTTTTAIPITVQRMEDERAPEGVCLGAFIGERLVARCAMPSEAIEHLLRLDLFADPVPLGLFAYEEEPGLQCRLFALVPHEKLKDADSADEPWKESVPSYEQSRVTDDSDPDTELFGDADEDGERERRETVLLGHIVRFESDRKHNDDLAAEAVDILQKIIVGGPLDEADTKAIDDLLDSL
ncbi:MAG: hypothetical protein H7099_19510 [Gemmatimonadaceae bacterium]|nr:hypothetical protein [Gemmatimonadaceae bacterium]